MKKILLGLFFLCSASNALVVGTLTGTTEQMCGEGYVCMFFFPTLTTTAPTVLVLDDEVGLNSEDMESLLYSEIGEDETPVTDAVARELGTTTATVQAAIAELVASGETITIANIKLLI